MAGAAPRRRHSGRRGAHFRGPSAEGTWYESGTNYWRSQSRAPTTPWPTARRGAAVRLESPATGGTAASAWRAIGLPRTKPPSHCSPANEEALAHGARRAARSRGWTRRRLSRPRGLRRPSARATITARSAGPETQANPAGLTARTSSRCLSRSSPEGLRNGEIAERARESPSARSTITSPRSCESSAFEAAPPPGRRTCSSTGPPQPRYRTSASWAMPPMRSRSRRVRLAAYLER